MAITMFITGEWGSVAMKLDLCRRDGETVSVVETATGSGVVGCPSFEDAFFAAVQPWLDAHGTMPVVLAGMIGSNIGWCDSGYVECPTDAMAMANTLKTLTLRGITIFFSPGLKCSNLFGQPDLMRGEEMQVLGWLSRRSGSGKTLVCLPGRHVKWVVCAGQAITSFMTGMTGELEDLLLTHGLLGKGVARSGFAPDAFEAGVDLIKSDPTLAMGHALFATRGRLVHGNHDAQSAASFLQGVLIGADVRDSVNAHRARSHVSGPVIILAHGSVADRYMAAFERLEIAAELVSANGLGAIGLASLLASSAHETQAFENSSSG